MGKLRKYLMRRDQAEVPRLHSLFPREELRWPEPELGAKSGIFPLRQSTFPWQPLDVPLFEKVERPRAAPPQAQMKMKAIAKMWLQLVQQAQG